MANMIHTSSAQDCLRVKTYLGDSAVLLAFDLDEHLTQNLAGFAIKCTPPNDKSFYLPNRLDFTTPVTSKTTPEQRAWHPSDQAHFKSSAGWIFRPILPWVRTTTKLLLCTLKEEG